MKRLLLVYLLVVVVPQARAQYWGERVLEKTFEQAAFFFAPDYLNPLGLGGFGSAAPGLVDDPLLELRLNPALLANGTTGPHYGYLDFRSSRRIEQTQHVYPLYHDQYVRTAGVYFPHYYVETQQPLEPVVSAAYFWRPGGRDSRFAAGGTYQLIFRDEDYYAVPVDIYRSRIGLSYAGDEMLRSDQIPIIDRYSGTDVMRQRGHFAALHAAYRLLPVLDAGVRLGRTVFDREGTFRSHNLWPSRRDYESLWQNREHRGQDYDHWDLSAGLRARFSDEVAAGMFGGYLWGSATQDLAHRDSSFSQHGSANTSNWSRYLRSGEKDQEWHREGGTYFGGAHFSAALAPGVEARLVYRLESEGVDLASASAIVDTSYSRYRWEGNGSGYESESYYALSDHRTGEGERTEVRHAGTAALQWQVDEATRVHFGLHLRRRSGRTDTREVVEAYQNHYYEYHHTSRQHVEAYMLREDKLLRWNFDTRETSVEVPVYVARRLSDAFELLFGVNRRMSSWVIEDETLAIFDERVETHNGATTRSEDFGERYHAPDERVSDVRTSLLAGVTISPAPPLDIRLMVVPRFGGTYGGTTLDRLEAWITMEAAL